MAKITQEKIELINELYCEMKVKSHVAKAVGCSPATVTKYLIPGYIPKAERREIKCVVEIKGADEFIRDVFDSCLCDSFQKNFSFLTQLDKIDNEGLEELRKEIF